MKTLNRYLDAYNSASQEKREEIGYHLGRILIATPISLWMFKRLGLTRGQAWAVVAITQRLGMIERQLQLDRRDRRRRS